jgi:hypothetical protein
MDNTTLADELEAWTLWSEQRPSDHTLNYRWRVPAQKILGMELRPEWTEKMHLCGMGYADNEWWPPFSHWDGYNRTVPKGTEWRIATEDETDVYWGGLHMEPSPFSGMPPKIEYHGRFIGAPPYQPEWLKIVSPMIGFNTWTDAAKMQAAWNTRTPALRTPAPAPVSGDVVEALFNHIKHGDDAHQAWLKAELKSFFAALQAQPTPAQGDVVERVGLLWSEATPPDAECSYDYCAAKTPFGNFQIEWKSWKEHPGYVCYFNGEFLATHDTLDGAKNACREWFAGALAEALAAMQQAPVSDAAKIAAIRAGGQA